MNESEIIGLILDGKRDMFRVLVEKYQSMVFRTCMGYLHNSEDAQDLTQEVFILAYQSLNIFKGDSSFSTWIYRITVNASLNRVRSNKRNPVLFRLDMFFGTTGKADIQFPFPDSEDPQSLLIDHENNKFVQAALDSLPENQRTAIVLSKYDDLSQKEIAVIMETTEGAVEALIQRAKSNLRNKLSHSMKKK
jgi:RNA polymerase sigma-70 factor (ECF subfamily)